MEHLLGTDSRNPAAKHRILEMYVEHGFEPPDTPVMALHRGRIDLLEAHLARDPDLLTRTFDIDRHLSARAGLRPRAVHGSGDAGARDDAPAHRRVLRRAGDRRVAARSGHGSGRASGDRRRWLRRLHARSSRRSSRQRNFWVNYGKGQPDEARFTRLLLDRGANPNVRASLRARLEEGHGGGPLHEYRDVTPLGWGEQFHAHDLREPRGASVDRGEGRWSMILSESRGEGRLSPGGDKDWASISVEATDVTTPAGDAIIPEQMHIGCPGDAKTRGRQTRTAHDNCSRSRLAPVSPLLDDRHLGAGADSADTSTASAATRRRRPAAAPAPGRGNRPPAHGV